MQITRFEPNFTARGRAGRGSRTASPQQTRGRRRRPVGGLAAAHRSRSYSQQRASPCAEGAAPVTMSASVCERVAVMDDLHEAHGAHPKLFLPWDALNNQGHNNCSLGLSSAWPKCGAASTLSASSHATHARLRTHGHSPVCLPYVRTGMGWPLLIVASCTQEEDSASRRGVSSGGACCATDEQNSCQLLLPSRRLTVESDSVPIDTRSV